MSSNPLRHDYDQDQDTRKSPRWAVILWIGVALIILSLTDMLGIGAAIWAASIGGMFLLAGLIGAAVSR